MSEEGDDDAEITIDARRFAGVWAHAIRPGRDHDGLHSGRSGRAAGRGGRDGPPKPTSFVATVPAVRPGADW
jgi:hypothetical protein